MIGFLQILIVVAVLALGVFMSVKKKSKSERDSNEFLPVKVKPAGIVVGLILVIVSIILVSAVGTIPAGHRGVVLRFGAVTGKVLDEGIFIVAPILESVEQMSVRVEAYEAEAASASRDLQEVSTKVTLNYYLDPKAVGRIFQTLRHDFEVRIIKPAIQEAVKASTAQFDAEKLITERPSVKEKIENTLKTRLGEHGIIVDAVSITDFSFSVEFTKAIEAKVTASQLALKAQRDLERIKMEAQQKIEQAKAEAEALKIQKQQVTVELIELRRIEVQRVALEKWNGVLPEVVTGNGPVPIIDLFKPRK